MLIEPSAANYALSRLRETDFYRNVHSQLFRIIADIVQRGDVCDIITVGEEIRKNGLGDDLIEYVQLGLVESVPTAANIEHYTNIVLQCSRLREIIAGCTKIITACYNESDDAVEMLTSFAVEIMDRGRQSDLVRVGDVIREHLDIIEARSKAESTRLFSSGFPTMDRLFGKLGEPNLIVLKGRRGRGKTHLAINWAYRCAQQGRACVIYSLEMGMHQIIDRLMARWSNVDSRMFRHIRSDSDWQTAVDAANALYPAPVYVCDDSRSVAQMHAECRRARLAGVDIGLVVVDFAELIVPPRGGRREEEELKANARLLGQLARDVDCTVVLVSQVNREGIERGSEGIGNRADLLLAWAYDDTAGTGVLKAEKNRFGPGFSVTVGIDLKSSNAWEITTETTQQ
jgi:replicative DNA helicase